MIVDDCGDDDRVHADVHADDACVSLDVHARKELGLLGLLGTLSPRAGVACKGATTCDRGLDTADWH